MDLNIIKDFVLSNGVSLALGIIGMGSIYMLGDNIINFFVKELFKREKIVLDFIDMLDEKLDDLQSKYPKSHRAIELRLLSLMDKIKAKIKDQGGVQLDKEKEKSKKCKGKMLVYARVVGFYRPVNQCNKGKREEIADRKNFIIEE